MTGFAPIAVVGRGCVLPDAFTPDAFWDNIAAERCSLSSVPKGRWRLPPEWAMGTVDDHVDRTWTDVGGYVQGFESVFDPGGFAIGVDQIHRLDPLYQWVLHGAREALREAGQDSPGTRTGLVLGNLSFPSEEMARFAELVWLESQPPAVRDAFGPALASVRAEHDPDARNRFSSGLPAHLAAKALGLDAGAYALDAACASSLYAIKLACDRLHDGTVELMLAGAVNRADDLFIHTGFCALSAMSRSGRSRPFHRGADGLVPAEGAAFVALMRLEDAVARGLRIHGVLRGIGLSNDGRGSGLLTPDTGGQERALRLAYQSAGIAPETVSLIECHATGTQVGDAVEVRSMARVFGDRTEGLPIGSVKSNVGHLVTAAGTAGLFKVLGAMRTGSRPATLGADEPLEALRDTSLRLLTEPEDWPGPHRAGISAFGFGGNNAHLVVEAWDGDTTAAVEPPPQRQDAEPVAIVAIGARVADGADTTDFQRAVLQGTPQRVARTNVEIALDELKFPPRDLEHTHAQQLLVMEAAREAVHNLRLPRERTMVLVGMGCDPDVARYGARWRIASWLQKSHADLSNDPSGLAGFRDAFLPPLTSAGVIGTMPNIVANRLNAQLDLAGPGFTVSAEEASGLVALDIAARALRTGETDAVLVGAVDLSHEPVHQAALRELDRDRGPGDAAVVLVLKRLGDARRDGDPVIAVLDDDRDSNADLLVGEQGFNPAELFGDAHAATGLVAVATAALALWHRAVPRLNTPADPALGNRTAEVVVSPLEAPPSRVRLRLTDNEPACWVPEPCQRMHIYSGRDLAGVVAALAAGRESNDGPARLVILAADDEQLATRIAGAHRWLTTSGNRPDGVAFRATPLDGEVGFVFTNGSASYPGMGRELMLAFPSIMDRLNTRCGGARALVGWAYADKDPGQQPVLEQIWGSSLLAQLHAEITRGVLGIKPHAVLGYSSGESTALVAMRAWRDIPSLVTDARNSELFRTALAGKFTAARTAWRRLGVTGERWASFMVSAPPAEVRAALADEAAVHLLAINTPEQCVVGGETAACDRVLRRLGAAQPFPIDYEIAVHAPEVDEVADQWWRLHCRPTHDVPGVRFYSCANAESYAPTPEAAADALTAQATDTIDFVRLIEQAWADGVRVFIEHGPRGLCTGWIEHILGDREHLAVAMDSAGGRGIRQLTTVVAELTAAGVSLTTDELFAHLGQAHPAPHYECRPHLSVPAHPVPVRLPTPEQPAQEMPRAPWLPPTSDPTPAPASGPASPQLVAVLEQQRRIAAQHESFLATQAHMHEQFLESRQRAEAVLFQVHKSVRNGHQKACSVLPPTPPPVSAPHAGSPEAPPVAQRAEPAIARPAVPPTAWPVALPGPTFSRSDLERLASERISDLFGPRFSAQDGFRRQTRMPQPPMLLADRVLGIDAMPCSMGTGTIWTETDVELGSWYLDACGRMPAGIMIEAGQADLLLISWLGVDLLNKGERVYRLLGCDVTFHGSPPVPGDTLRYEISIDGHGEHDGIRLFFFHYDCYVGDQLRLSIRNGQAGFFSDAELADSRGVLWEPAEEHPEDVRPVDSPAVTCTKARFDPDEVRAFAEGRPADCFGSGWEQAKAQIRSPRIGEDRMQLIHEVTEFDPAGGPGGRGYLRAQLPIFPEAWFFEGHFANDPCMPGTLMFEGCLQAMAFYLAAMGFTLTRDGWRFEPLPDQAYHLSCRGQVTPQSRMVIYEVFVSRVSADPTPTLVAEVLCSVDGVKAFHASHVALHLIPDWPLEHWRELGTHAEQETGELAPLHTLGGLRDYRDQEKVAVVDGFAFDYASLLACAWGRPSHAFGPSYAVFDGPRRCARLPGPPYHFMTRVISVEGPQNGMRVGSRVVTEYDVPDEVWYFQQNTHPIMPFCVLMEVALQPCGWLASYAGSALTTDTDLLFRNLDGTGTVFGEVTPGTRTIRTHAELTNISPSGDMIIESFTVRCVADETPIFELSTVFGYFPAEVFVNQTGLPRSSIDHAALESPSDDVVDLAAQTTKHHLGELRLAAPMLLMLDRITGYWSDGGKAGLGRLRSEKRVNADDWFFSAHFFQDPVQPGSLGVEAMCQLLQFYMIEQDLGTDIANPRFEPVMIGREVTWRYRGQVTPANRFIRIEMDITGVGEDDRGAYATAEAWLWADNKCIYHATGLGMRVVPSQPRGGVEYVFDPAVDTWLLDHRPTWTVPTLPMMSAVDLLARSAHAGTGRDVVALRDVKLERWVPISEPVKLVAEIDVCGDEVGVTMMAWRKSATPTLSRFEPVATAVVLTGAQENRRPARWEPLTDTESVVDPYESGTLFHGPSFQYLVSLQSSSTGSAGVLDAGRGSVPRGLLHQGLLDAATHVIPHDQLWRWSPEIRPDYVGYPQQIETLEIFEPLPSSGSIDVEARFAGFRGSRHSCPMFDLRLSRGDRVLAAIRLVDVLMPKGRLGSAPAADRRVFLRDQLYANGLGLSTTENGVTQLSANDVDQCDWLPGTVAHTYNLPANTRGRDRLAHIAIRDHIARHLHLHPSTIDLADDLQTAWPTSSPRNRHIVQVERQGDHVRVRNTNGVFGSDG